MTDRTDNSFSDGAPVYADGSEQHVLEVVTAATDVGSRSTELLLAATSWASLYHLSPQRGELVAPLRTGPGSTVVELGCGTGAVTRALGETGATVTAVEGSRLRAAAAAQRCRDLPGVRVVEASNLGALEELGGVDLVVLCGVLEYSAGQPGGAAALLAAVAGALGPDGAVAVAVENQIGVGYLAGRAEDHLDRPWVGVADYPAATPAQGRAGTRTWTRAALGRQLADAGLPEQRWFGCYPDYKLPRVVVDLAVLQRGGAAAVEQLVGDPDRGSFGGNRTAVPARALHSVLLGDGLGAHVPPSFLVVAGRSTAAVAAATEPGDAFLLGGARRARWHRRRVLDGDRLRTLGGAREVVRSERWLHQHVPAEEEWTTGRPLDALLTEALAAADVPAVDRLLRTWSDVVCRGAVDQPGPARTPFLPGRPGVSVLPADRLDVHPGNVLVAADGTARAVDTEWHAEPGVDADLARLRGLTEIARDLLLAGAALPWPHRTVARLRSELARPLGLADAATERREELLDAEAELQELVTGVPRARVRAGLVDLLDTVHPVPLWRHTQPTPDPASGTATTEGVRHELRVALEGAAATRAGLAHLSGELDRTRAEVVAHRTELDAAHRHALELLAALTDEERSAHEAGATAAAERDLLGHRITELDAVCTQLELDLDAVLTGRAGERAELAALRREHDELSVAIARARVESTAAVVALARLEASNWVALGHRWIWRGGRIARGSVDLLRGRPGEETDGVLSGLARLRPALASRAAHRLPAARPDRTLWSVEPPAGGVPVELGRGQCVPFTGWVAHPSLAVLDVELEVGGHRVRLELRQDRQDVRAHLRGLGWTSAPTRTGWSTLVDVPARQANPSGQPLTEVAVALLVRLADGTHRRHTVAPLRVRVGDGGPARHTPARTAVVLATYEPDPGYLREQCDSLRRQTDPSWVCLVTDDGSSATGRAAIAAAVGDDPRFLVVHHRTNVGFYRNFERGTAAATGLDVDAIALCDQDDVWHPDKLERLWAAMDSPSVQLVYGDVGLVDDAGLPLGTTFWDERPTQTEDLATLVMVNSVPGAALLVRRELVATHALPFPVALASSFHDHWLAVTARTAGTVRYLDEPVQDYRQHDGNVTGHSTRRLDDQLPLGDTVEQTRRLVAGLPPDVLDRLRWGRVQDVLRVRTAARTLLLRHAPDGPDREVLGRLGELTPWWLHRRARQPHRAGGGVERYLLCCVLVEG